MSKKDFLSILKIRNSGTNADNRLRSPHELRVQVTPAYTKGVQIAIVDKKGVKQSPGDYSRKEPLARCSAHCPISDLENVDVDYEGRKVKYVSEPVDMTPILDFAGIYQNLAKIRLFIQFKENL